MANDIKKYLDKFNKTFDQLESSISFSDMMAPTISKVSVGWHIEHILLSFNEYVDLLSKSNPKEYKWKFNFLRNVVLLTNLIPRGFGKSPKDMLPNTKIDKQNLVTLISSTRKNILHFEQLPKDKFIEHPVFGQLKLIQTLSFLDTHAYHHLKIIDDIVQCNNK
jgi:hypothetical protein